MIFGPCFAEVETAWMAGLFDGEGWIRLHGRTAIEVGLGMTDLDLVTRFSIAAGCGNKIRTVHDGRPGHKPMFIWSVSRSTDALNLLRRMSPWFGERRNDKFLEASQWRSKPLGTGEWCGRGHPLSNGRCNECRRARYATK